MKATLILLLASAASAVHLTKQACGCDAAANVCPLPNYQLNCGNIDTPGYGKITEKEKHQCQEAAQANNEYENELHTLKTEGQDKSCETSSHECNGCGSMTDIIHINGEYEADSTSTCTHHAKDALSGKGAQCFRRESQQHLNQIDGQDHLEPLRGKDLCSCSCTDAEDAKLAKSYKEGGERCSCAW